MKLLIATRAIYAFLALAGAVCADNKATTNNNSNKDVHFAVEDGRRELKNVAIEENTRQEPRHNVRKGQRRNLGSSSKSKRNKEEPEGTEAHARPFFVLIRHGVEELMLCDKTSVEFGSGPVLEFTPRTDLFADFITALCSGERCEGEVDAAVSGERNEEDGTDTLIMTVSAYDTELHVSCPGVMQQVSAQLLSCKNLTFGTPCGACVSDNDSNTCSGNDNDNPVEFSFSPKKNFHKFDIVLHGGVSLLFQVAVTCTDISVDGSIFT